MDYSGDLDLTEEINIRNYELSIRKADAELISIEEIEKKED